MQDPPPDPKVVEPELGPLARRVQRHRPVGRRDRHPVELLQQLVGRGREILHDVPVQHHLAGGLDVLVGERRVPVPGPGPDVRGEWGPRWDRPFLGNRRRARQVERQDGPDARAGRDHRVARRVDQHEAGSHRVGRRRADPHDHRHLRVEDPLRERRSVDPERPRRVELDDHGRVARLGVGERPQQVVLHGSVDDAVHLHDVERGRGFPGPDGGLRRRRAGGRRAGCGRRRAGRQRARRNPPQGDREQEDEGELPAHRGAYATGPCRPSIRSTGGSSSSPARAERGRRRSRPPVPWRPPAPGSGSCWSRSRAGAARSTSCRSPDSGFEERRTPLGFSILAVTAREALLEYLWVFFKMGALSRSLARAQVVETVTDGVPGFRDLMIAGKMYELTTWRSGSQDAEARRRAKYDLVVVDAPPTGQVLGMLGAPRAYRGMIRGGRPAQQLVGIDRLFREESRVALVTTPEDLAVTETLETVDALRVSGVAGAVDRGEPGPATRLSAWNRSRGEAAHGRVAGRRAPEGRRREGRRASRPVAHRGAGGGGPLRGRATPAPTPHRPQPPRTSSCPCSPRRRSASTRSSAWPASSIGGAA